MPGGWVTLQDVYRCTIDAELFAGKIGEAKDLVARLCPVRVAVAGSDLVTHKEALEDWAWEPVPGTQKGTCRLDPGLRERLGELGIAYETEESEGGAGSELREQVEAIERWYLNDWMALDPKLRTSIVEGISVFLSLFDQPQVARVFCPPPPDSDASIHMYSTAPDEDSAAVRPVPGLRRRLPPLAELIEGGRVLALNMPAGANPALGRAIGVLLTQLTGDFPGPVLATVSVPFYSADRQRILIPRGARVVGTAQAVQDPDQSRLAVAFHRLLLPDGSWIDLEFTGLNQAGEGALRDQVDRHYFSTFAAAGAVGVVSGLALAGGSPFGLRAGVGQGLGQSATSILDRFLNRLPTITIRAGHRLRIWFTSDVLVPRAGPRQ